MGSGTLGFLADPQLSTDFVCLYQPPFELSRISIGLSMLFPST